MANTITTTGFTPSVTTSHQDGESVREWVERHNESLYDGTPGSTLETSWTSGEGPQKVKNQRLPGESDAAFVTRHIESYLVVMVETPPVP
jgi:hypothetical protein